MNSFQFSRRTRLLIRGFLIFVFLSVQIAFPFNGEVGDVQAASILEPEAASVMGSGQPRPQAAVANLLLTKSIDGDITSADVGDTIFYRLRFQCSSLTTDCGALEITDALSPNFTYLPAQSSVPNGYILSYDSPSHTVTITKDGDDFLDGSQADAVIAVQINYDMRPLSDTIDNQAVGRVKPPSEANWLAPVTADAPTITVDPVSVNWTLSKTLYSPSIDPTVDTNVIYRLRLCPDTTSGNVALTGVTITDILPAGVEFISASDGGSESGGNVTWSIPGPLTPPSCATRYVTVRFNSSDGFTTTSTNITNTANATSDYEDNNGDPCPSCYGSGSVPRTHDLQNIVEGINYSKSDTGDPVGINGTGRFALSLNTNATNYPANEVVMIDHLPPELKVMQITSGAWTQALDGIPLFDIVHATIQYSTYDSPNIDTPGEWITLGTVDHNDNTLYSTLPNNITAVRWNFEHDSDRNGSWEAGLPFDWSFSSSPQIRVTPRLDTTDTTTDSVALAYVDPATLPQTYSNCLVVRRRNSSGTLVGGDPTTDCATEQMTVDQDFVSLDIRKRETPGTSYDSWNNPNISNFTSDSTILPNDTLRYTITVNVTERSSIALDGLTVRDVMPANMVFVRQGNILFGGSPLPAFSAGEYDIESPPSFTQSGQTLTWSWNNDAGSSPTLFVEPRDYGNRTLTIEYYARILPGTAPNTYTNNLYTATDTTDVRCERGSRVQDTGQINNDGEYICDTPDTYRVERSAALRGEKWIRSINDTPGWMNATVVDHATFATWPLDTTVPPAANHCPDGGTAGLPAPGSTNVFTRYPCVSQAYPEGALGPNEHVAPTAYPDLDDFEYNLRIFNEGNVPMLEYVLYDILPYWGDTGSGGVLQKTDRESEFRPILTGPVQFIQGVGLSSGDFTIDYSFSTNPCRQEVFDKYEATNDTPNGCTDDWTTTVADWSTVRAYRIRLNAGAQIAAAVPAGSELRFGMLMSIPKDAPPSGFDEDDAQTREIAWNSFAHVGAYDHDNNVSTDALDLLASEPRKVGITIPERLSIGNRVWRDSDNSGTINAPDDINPGISSVTVNLYLASDTSTAIATTTTDSGGYYLFSNLPEGDYVVGIPAANFGAGQPLESLRSSTGTPAVSKYTDSPVDGNIDQEDHGIDPASQGQEVFSPTIVLSYNSEETSEADLSDNDDHGPEGARRGLNAEKDDNSDLTVDFGFFGGTDVPFSIGNHLWIDDGAGGGVGNDGIRNGTEASVVGARVELYRDGDGDGIPQDDELIRFDVTNANGFYLFDNLDPGSYYVKVAAGNFGDVDFDPDGSGTDYTATTPPLFGLLSSQPTGTENVGVTGNTHTPNTDGDDNGINTPSPEIDGVLSGEIILTRNFDEALNESHLSGETDPGAPDNADYNPTGWDGPNSRGRFGETDNTSNLTIDFGFYPVFSVGNRVWFDTNNDSTMGAGETGVSGVRVQLYNADGTSEILVGADGVLGTADDGVGGMLTDADGYYLFDNLPPGTYTVVLTSSNFGSSAVLEGYWSSGTGRDGTGAVVESAAPDPDNNTDLDDNGSLQNSGTFSGGVIALPVTLGPAYDEPTDDDDLAAGGQGQPDNQANMTVDFGFYTMNIGNLVWLDSDYSGTVTGAEAGIDDVTVELYAADSSGDPVGAALASVQTGSGSWGTGEYNFIGLPAGDYIVRIPASEFEGTETLVGYVTSEGAASYYEPAPDADTDTADNDDNGSETGGTTGAGGFIQSEVVTLTPANEASFDNATGTTNEPRVDFGVFKLSAATKSLIATSEADSTGTLVFIGETLTYQIQITVPPGTMYSLKAVDVMEDGLAFDDCIDATATNETNVTSSLGDLSLACPAASGDANVTNDGHTVTFNFGDVSNSGTTDETIIVQYHVVVLDIASNENGVDDINNQVTWTWTGEEHTGQAEPVEIIEPDMDIEKTTDTPVSPLNSIIPFTIEIYQTDESAATAYDVIVTDVLPEGLEYVDGSISAGFPFAWDDFDYDIATRTMTITWDEFPLLNGAERARTEITFDATFIGPSPLVNQANVEWTSLPIDPQLDGTPVQQSDYNEDSTERWYDPADIAEIDDYGRSSSIDIRVPRLPATGFTPNQVTQLPKQTSAKSYQNMGATWVEIPRLNVSIPIVGVPLDESGWDLTWLGGQAGYLEGTAYPTLPGNTALTAHVYLPNGQPGPFVNLHTLVWGDEVIVHANGQRYLYQVRTQRKVWPHDLSIIKHEVYDWVTLITCQGYDEADDSYNYRIAVRAVLIAVEADSASFFL